MCARIRNLATRGIAMKEGMTLRDMYEERRPLYEKYADFIIDCGGGTVEETVAHICSCLDISEA